jgi:drug/metabolite transporter (DMT)-like permease
MKIIVGMGLCIIGVIIWAAPLVASSVIVNPTVISLGVIIGGGIIMSGIALICLPTHPIRVPYFDKTP